MFHIKKEQLWQEISRVLSERIAEDKVISQWDDWYLTIIEDVKIAWDKVERIILSTARKKWSSTNGIYVKGCLVEWKIESSFGWKSVGNRKIAAKTMIRG